jgi:hypothetical protein
MATITSRTLSGVRPASGRAQGRIQRRHQTPGNRILLENQDLQWHARTFDTCVERDNHSGCHEWFANFAPAYVCFGRDIANLSNKRKTRDETPKPRRMRAFRRAAGHQER